MRMQKWLMGVTLFGATAAFALAQAPAGSAKAELQKLNEFIGEWKGNGESKSGKSENWKEQISWGWKIKGDEVAINVTFKDGKAYNGGVMRYNTSKKKYEFLATTVDKKEQLFTGEIKAKRLILTYADPESKDKTTIEMSTNNEGARFVYSVAVQKRGVGLDKKMVQVDVTKEGVSLAGGKKPECIVTGGLGTMAVSFGGKTYYVCCSGCRDEFNANPKKYVDEYEKSKK